MLLALLLHKVGGLSCGTASVILMLITKNDLKESFIGLWQLIHGFQWEYIGCNPQPWDFSAGKNRHTCAAFFVDHSCSDREYLRLPWIGSRFCRFGFMRGRFCFGQRHAFCRTAKVSPDRLRKFLYDHIKH